MRSRTRASLVSEMHVQYSQKIVFQQQAIHLMILNRLTTQLVSTLSVLLLCSRATNAESPPNIIVMMADDMGLGDTSAYQKFTGNSDAVQVQTPAMEKLARMGIRFTDAHSPSSRCTATRAALLTGRYTWRTRLKYSVLWGPQGDPLIEPDRPTLATLLKSHDYRTGMTGKWHCGLTYRNSMKEASAYQDADLRAGIADGPLNHGFDFFHGTSRSHPTSKAQGWLFGDIVVAATGSHTVDESQYVLHETGPTNYKMAKQFLTEHLNHTDSQQQPFFLYYACHSNHTTHNPCNEIEGIKVSGASHPGGKRSDFIYENDVALGLLIQFLEETADPRNQQAKLIENTLIIFTSDNGAENKQKTATGPLRSNKGSVYEGGHRVPFIAAWKAGGIGDGNPETAGQVSAFPICHVDLFATFSEILREPIPKSGAEDSFSILSALKGKPSENREPLIHHDHTEGAKPKKANNPEAAWLAIRMDDPEIDGTIIKGQWKLFVDHNLLINGNAQPRELYNLRVDLKEQNNRIKDPKLRPLVNMLREKLQTIHDCGGIRYSPRD